LRVLVAGIGGASLGTEILKSLLLASRYSVFGCDISDLAFGHYQIGCKKTFVVDRSKYIESIMEVCRKADIQVVIPGGEEPLNLLSEAVNELAADGITLAANSPSVVAQFSDKACAFEKLAGHGIAVPRTVVIEGPSDLTSMSFPCVIKPATGSGGSAFVFLAASMDEALLYSNYLSNNQQKVIAQEYIAEDEGEFTVGVLSLPNGDLAGSIALQRQFDSKLSVLSKTKSGLISSGYSQGLIDHFPSVCADAERIAKKLGSRGPLNIQGRVCGGSLIPFEINVRFSASTYLRAMAGFNELDIYLQYLRAGSINVPSDIRPGYYLRSLSEVYVPKGDIAS